MADVLTDINGFLNVLIKRSQTYEAIIAAIDTDDDGSISSAEIIAALPGEALAAAAGTGGPSTWGGSTVLLSKV